MPVQEGEVEGLRLRHRAPGEPLPEQVEGLAIAALGRPQPYLEAPARHAAHLALGPLAHLPGEAALAAVAPVEAAHRQARRLRHLLGPHMAEAAHRHQRGRLAHVHDVQLLQAPHPRPLPAPGGDPSVEGAFLPPRPVYPRGLTWWGGRARRAVVTWHVTRSRAPRSELAEGAPRPPLHGRGGTLFRVAANQGEGRRPVAGVRRPVPGGHEAGWEGAPACRWSAQARSRPP
jgi:hypothetical protein